MFLIQTALRMFIETVQVQSYYDFMTCKMNLLGVFLWFDLDLDYGSLIQDHSGSCCIKETLEPTLVTDSLVPLMHHDLSPSYLGRLILIADLAKGTQP